MNRFLNALQQLMDAVARNTLLVVFSVILAASLVVKAMYRFDDSPYFTMNTFLDYACILLVCLGIWILYKFRNAIQDFLEGKRFCYVLLFLCYIGAAVLYFRLVPLIPFSDMGGVARGAIRFATSDWSAFYADEYWQSFSGNIRLSVFWGLLLLPFPKTFLSLKIINAVMTYAVIMITRELAKSYGVTYYNIVYLMMLSSVSLFLYSGQIYFDIPITIFLLSAIYMFREKHSIVLACVLLGIARCIRKNTGIFFLAIVFVYIFQWNQDRRAAAGPEQKKLCLRKLFLFLCGIMLYFSIYQGVSSFVQERFISGHDLKKYPSWNIYYIAINEEEFGFMDNDFSYDRTAQDIVDRIVEYGPVRLGKILLKKTFWLWSQGTYQAQRYAFGDDVGVGTDKFECDTFLTGHLLTDDQPLRVILNSFMRAQYLAAFALMLFSFAKTKKRADFRLFYYIIMATFLVMIIYELKSRYILQLLPFMMIMAGDALACFFGKDLAASMSNQTGRERMGEARCPDQR